MPPAPAAMDVDDEGAGGGARNRSTMVVVKSDCTNTDPLVVGRALTHQWRAMPPAPAAMDVDDEGAGGGARNRSTMVVVKSDCTNTDPLVVGPESVEDEGGGGDTTECSSSFGDTCSGFQDAAGAGEPEVNSGMSARADGGRPWKPPR